MTRRKRAVVVVPPMARRSSVVCAIFDPDGDIHVRAVAPSGNAYEIAPRVSFPIATEDVDWFFHEWHWERRQRLCRAEEYQPRRPQFDNGKASRDEAAVIVALELPPHRSPEPVAPPPVEPEPEPEESIEPDPVTEAGEDETKEDKE